MRFSLPFAQKPKSTIVPVGNEDVGIIYLQKINTRTGIERKALDKVDELETKLQLLIYKLAKKIAVDKGIEIEEALQLVFTEDSDSTELANYSDELEKMMALKAEAEAYRDEVITVMIRERITYPVTAAATSRKGEDKIQIEASSFDIPVKAGIKFDNTIVYLGAQCPTGDSTILSDEPLLKTIEEGSRGFLVDDNGEYVVGNPEWDLESTSRIPDSIANEIFQFYQGELAGGNKETGKKERLKNPSKSLKKPSSETESTGTASTGKAEDTEVLTTES